MLKLRVIALPLICAALVCSCKTVGPAPVCPVQQPVDPALLLPPTTEQEVRAELFKPALKQTPTSGHFKL